MHKVYDVQSAAPPLADISIIRVHIALVPAQIVVPRNTDPSLDRVKFSEIRSSFIADIARSHTPLIRHIGTVPAQLRQCEQGLRTNRSCNSTSSVSFTGYMQISNI